MPADLLTIAFALTLVVNALFVFVAIRALRLGRFDVEGPASERDVRQAPSTPGVTRVIRPDPPDVVRAVAARRAALADAPSTLGEPARTPPAAPSAPAPSPVRAVAEDLRTPAPMRPAPMRPAPTKPARATPRVVEAEAEEPAEEEPPAVESPTAAIDVPEPASPKPTPPPPEATPGPGSEVDRRGSAKGRGKGGKGRRKFSLPPLDDDHEKVSRSIESFLAGGDPATDVGAGGSAGSAGAAATTVALIAIIGADDDPADDDAAAAMVERTLRSAARGTDVVDVEDRARFRIVLSGTGELAARAYLRRVRATVEPLLEAADTPLRLVIATATVLDEPAEAAAVIAARRLEVALDTVSTDGADGATAAPRAAAD